MRILFLADEVYPLYKIGGLADVAGSLPKALQKLEADVRVMMPKHPEVDLEVFEAKLVDEFEVVYDSEKLLVKVHESVIPGSKVPVYVVEESKYLSQQTDASDNHADKFAAFSLCCATWLKRNQLWQPHVVHLNDWHTALVPLISKHVLGNDKYKYMMTIHNLAYQGDTDTRVAGKLGIETKDCRFLDFDLGDQKTNILLEGIVHSDSVVAVSPTYADEILTSEYGEKIEALLESQKGKIVGILNGLDLDVFNSETDKFIYQNFNDSNIAEGKLANKLALQKELGLEVSENKVLIGFVGRVDPGQKGVQLIIEALNNGDIVNQDRQFVFLGTGAVDLEDGLHKAGDNRENLRIYTRYDEPLAAKIYAASDVTLIPSKYEPCGLVQMISMRYAALPIARRTGGLADTIIDRKNGFLFDKYETSAFVNCLEEALAFLSDKNTMDLMRIEAMKTDFAWDASAVKYLDLYESLITS